MRKLTSSSSTPSSVKVEADEIKDKLQDLSSFIEERIGVKPTMSGNSLVIEGKKTKVPVKLVKTYLKRFLHKEGLKGELRVLVRKGVISVKRISRKAETS